MIDKQFIFNTSIFNILHFQYNLQSIKYFVLK